MKSMWILKILLLLSIFGIQPCVWSWDPYLWDMPASNLMQDLLIVNYWDQRINDHLPVLYNHFLQGGYLNMPSARMGREGEIGFGYASVSPYRVYSLRCQFTEQLELILNYRIFKGLKDPIFGHLGFGDRSDKGVSFKFSLFSPEDSQYELPGVAIGFDDLLGTRNFKSSYLVFTYVLLNYHLEMSIGYGSHRLKRWFGGLSWMPFRQIRHPYLKNLTFTLEYDATPYKDQTIELHPKGRQSRTPINFGLKYRLWDSIDLSFSFVRGNTVACSASGYFNFGTTSGLLPKVENPLPYTAPIITEEIGPLRPEDVLAQEFAYAFLDQGFELIEAWKGTTKDCQLLRFKVNNLMYREECHVRNRLNALLSALTPSDIDLVIVTIETDVLPIQEYHYVNHCLRAYRQRQIGRYELNVLSPLYEATWPNPFKEQLIFSKKHELWNLELMPKTHTLFGSTKGKFKGAVGLSLHLNGYLFSDLYYSLAFGYFVFSNLYELSDYDMLNPSHLINVRTDSINYFKQKCVTIDEAFVEKLWTMGGGWYGRLAVGLFEPAYGGLATQVLYYPIRSRWAVGIEGALLAKRKVKGIYFTNKVRLITEDGKHVYKRYRGSQYFLNFYYNWKESDLEFKLSLGKFLAHDYGGRFELSRYFPSGLRMTFWYTYTNANDRINGERYHDKGVYFSMPLDIFYTKSSRSRWGYGMSAWLRDTGITSYTGNQLYDLINEQRQ
jgi:hypothetical protein